MYSHNEVMYFVFYFNFLNFIFLNLFYTLLNKEILGTFHLWGIQ